LAEKKFVLITVFNEIIHINTLFKNMTIYKRLHRTIKTRKTFIPLNNLCKFNLNLIMIHCS